MSETPTPPAGATTLSLVFDEPRGRKKPPRHLADLTPEEGAAVWELGRRVAAAARAAGLADGVNLFLGEPEQVLGYGSHASTGAVMPCARRASASATWAVPSMCAPAASAARAT